MGAQDSGPGCPVTRDARRRRCNVVWPFAAANISSLHSFSCPPLHSPTTTQHRYPFDHAYATTASMPFLPADGFCRLLGCAFSLTFISFSVLLLCSARPAWYSSYVPSNYFISAKKRILATALQSRQRSDATSSSRRYSGFDCTSFGRICMGMCL